MKFQPGRLILTTATCVALIGGSFLAYRLARAEVAADVYKDRLAEVAQEYETLRATYNDAVQRTAVSELLVTETSLAVRIRNDAGEVATVETPFDPNGEVYLDYVVIDGRLWVRRVFDQHTAPADAIVIDPQLARIDWTCDDARHGKAIYRALTPGRWIISVTGNGSLGLVQAAGDETVRLTPPPEVRDFTEVAQETQADIDAISLTDVWSALRD